MYKLRTQQIAAAFMVAVMLLTSVSALARAADESAPAMQQLQAQEVAGSLPGGEFAKIWLGLKPRNPGDTITLVSEWNRSDPLPSGVGFFVLDETGLRRVLSGAANAREANLAAGSVINDAPSNQLGATFRATGSDYTVILFNDSSGDADFTLTATNGIITDDSGQVQSTNAVTATATPAPEEEAEAPVASPAPVTATTTATPTVAAVATPVPVATDPVTGTTPAAAVSVESGVVRSQVMEGELPEQDAKHFLALEPSVRDGVVKLTLEIEPQDNQELTRRLNFWVLDEAGFKRYTEPGQNVLLSNVAIAAGTNDGQSPAHVRTASFTSSGFGPYAVIVVNGARQAGEYSLRVDGGLLVDDSGQTTTAQQSSTAAAPAAATGEAPATGATAEAVAPAVPGREGEPGGTYTVASGDTLSLIARDIYGDVSLYQALCDFNGIADCNIIEVGDVLRLPTREEIGAGITAPAAPAAAATPAVTATPAPQPEAVVTTTVVTTGTVAPAPTVTTTTAVTTTAVVTETAATTGTTSAAPTSSGLDIVDTAIAAGSFTKLIAAVEAAGLTDTLKGGGPYTVLAPTDAAFAALDAVAPGAMNQLMAQPTGQLTDILLFHVLRNELLSSDISNGMQVTTSQGNPVTFEVAGDALRVNGANLVQKDIVTSNGVIQVIDAVLLPY